MTGQTPGPPTQAFPIPDPGTDLATLQSQLTDVRVELSGLQAQWNGLQSQLNAMLRNNPARPGVQQQWADVGVQMARVEGNIAFLEARVAQKQGLPVGVSSRQVNRRPFDTNLVVPAGTAMLVMLAFPVSFAWARRILRGTSRPAPPSPDHTMRLERIEQAVDTIAIEVERISEGQRFVTRVLAQRPVPAAGDDVSTNAPLSQAKPPLALGAGPMEPIAVPERERARQRMVTPH